MLAYEKATGRKTPELELPDLPDRCESIWNAFLMLNQTRPFAEGGCSGITWSEIHAWQSANHLRMSPWELDTIAALDRAVLPILNKKTTRS